MPDFGGWKMEPPAVTTAAAAEGCESGRGDETGAGDVEAADPGAGGEVYGSGPDLTDAGTVGKDGGSTFSSIGVATSTSAR